MLQKIKKLDKKNIDMLYKFCMQQIKHLETCHIENIYYVRKGLNMKNDSYNVFLILGGLNPILRAPLSIFLEKDYTTAKLYFQGWLIGTENPERYVLYKIGEIDRKGNFTQKKAYITGGYEMKEAYNFSKIDFNQIKLKIEKEREAERAYEKSKNKEELIKFLFEGKIINE